MFSDLIWIARGKPGEEKKQEEKKTAGEEEPPK